MRGRITWAGIAARESGDGLATVVVYGGHMSTKGDPMKDSLPRDERYHAYLVRLWQDRPKSPWRAIVRDSANDEERRFATIEELFLFLHRQTDGRQHNEVSDPSVQEGPTLTYPSVQPDPRKERRF
jgi:hypothetical protein